MKEIRKFALLAAAVALLTMTAFAAVRWLTPSQVAEIGRASCRERV